MSGITGIGSDAAMTELVEAQSQQMAELLKAITSANVGFAEKLVRLNAELQVQASEQDTIGQALDLYV